MSIVFFAYFYYYSFISLYMYYYLGSKLGQTYGCGGLYLPSTETKDCLESCSSEETKSRHRELISVKRQ